MTEPSGQRAQMVERQLAARGIEDRRVLEAMRELPRESFVSEKQRACAYADQALPIGGGQTISQPYVIAATFQALRLRGHERVLEIGTGSGYSAAVLGRLAAEVVSVERDPQLAAGARSALAAVNAGNVEVITGDGSRGVPERAPFDAVAVHARAPEVPDDLLDQLAPAGRLVVPLPGNAGDALTLFTESGGGFRREVLDVVRFVPLVRDD